MSIFPFTIEFRAEMLRDLRRRLHRVNWSDAVTDDWHYGTNRSFLMALVDYWRSAYDFDRAIDRMNLLPQFRATVDGFGVHYAFLKGQGPNAKPLLLMNGWPSSFLEYARLAPRLANPAAYGGSPADAFDVVMPTLPGFGFSDHPQTPYQVDTVTLFHRLMTDNLQYETYFASGSDIGAGVATRLALTFPDQLRGIHIAAAADPSPLPKSSLLSAAERLYRGRARKWERSEGAYEHVHYTRPQTLAFALADSPAGMASWITEKFYAWSDHDTDLLDLFPLDFLIDNLMVYWVSGAIGSSIRYYYDTAHHRPPLAEGAYVTVPTAVCLWPYDLARPPREWAERLYNVGQYTIQSAGGHFSAWEEPAAYAADLSTFCRGR